MANITEIEELTKKLDKLLTKKQAVVLLVAMMIVLAVFFYVRIEMIVW